MGAECVKREDVYNQTEQEVFVEVTDNQIVLSQITGAVSNVVKWGVGSTIVGGGVLAAIGAASAKPKDRLQTAAVVGTTGAAIIGTSVALAESKSFLR
jgi:hypothetical protein